MADMEDVLNPPPEDLKASILKDLREDEGRLEHNLKLLETWLSCQSHLPKYYDKMLLTHFLRGCKHDLRLTKKRLECFFIIKTAEESLFRNRAMTMERDLMVPKYGLVLPLPETTPEGYRIILRTATSKDDFTVNILQTMLHELMICDIRLHHETLVNGNVFVFDARNVSVSNSPKILCSESLKIIRFGQDALPNRLKQIHLITTNSMMVMIMDFVKQMISDKLASRVFTELTLVRVESFFKVIPKRLFPSDFGGEKKSTLEIMEEWNKKFVELEGWFQKLEDLKASGPIPKELGHLFSGVYSAEGSFRKLNID